MKVVFTLGVALMLGTAAGCDDEPARPGVELEASDGGRDAGTVSDAAPASDAASSPDVAPAPLYALMSEVYAPDFSSSVSYLTTLSSLNGEVDLSKAREYSGRATMATHNGWLFVADAQFVITRYAVDAAGALVEQGKISLADRGLEYATVDPWGNTFVSPTKAYLWNATDGSLIVWNPSTMEITGEIKTPGLVRGMLDLQNSPGIVRGKHLYLMLSWADFTAHTFSSEPQVLAVFDVETDKLVELIPEPRCPSLYGRPFLDEQNNIYFTNFIWSVGETLVKAGPKHCSVRIPAGSDRPDPAWTLPYASVAEGREGAGLSYLGGGKALLEVFHQERTTIDAMTDPSELAISTNWRLWTVDINARTGAPIEGLDWEAGGYSPLELGGRRFVLLSGENYADTTAFEITGGQATRRFKVKGSTYLVLKLR